MQRLAQHLVAARSGIVAGEAPVADSIRRVLGFGVKGWSEWLEATAQIADSLEDDGDFRTVIQHGSAAMKQSMAEKDGGLPLTHFAEYAEQFKNGVFSFKASSEEPEGLEKEMLEVSNAKGLEEELNHIATEGVGVEKFRKVRMRGMNDPHRPVREEAEDRKQEGSQKEEEEAEIILG